MNSLVSNQTHNLIGKVMIWRKIVAFWLGFEGRKGIRKCFWVWRTKERQEKEVGPLGGHWMTAFLLIVKR